MHEFVMPKINYYGKDSLNSLKSIISKNNLRKGLIITDENLYNLGYTKQISDTLKESVVELNVYHDVRQNPTISNVNEALEIIKSDYYDFIIGLGGGSSNDCAKAVSILATNDKQIPDLVGLDNSENDGLFLISINTTSGTASEISRAYLIDDAEKKEKYIMKDINALPNISINDTNIMLNLPPNITAMTGMDALTHAIESYVSKGSYGLTKELSISATYLIFNNLDLVVNDGNNINARDNMVYAQTLAGMSFCNSGVGLTHSMAHQLGAVYGIPHGLANAILLPYVIEQNSQFVKNEYEELFTRVFNTNCDNKVEALIDKIVNLSKNIGTFKSLRELGVIEDDFLLLTKKAMNDGNIYKNPFLPKESDILEIWKKAY